MRLAITVTATASWRVIRRPNFGRSSTSTCRQWARLTEKNAINNSVIACTLCICYSWSVNNEPVASTLFCNGRADVPGEVVSTPLGKVSGIVTASSRSFKGIPFARERCLNYGSSLPTNWYLTVPPVGSLRWVQPQRVCASSDGPV